MCRKPEGRCVTAVKPPSSTMRFAMDLLSEWVPARSFGEAELAEHFAYKPQHLRNEGQMHRGLSVWCLLELS